jgi:hypothetical protein
MERHFAVAPQIVVGVHIGSFLLVAATFAGRYFKALSSRSRDPQAKEREREGPRPTIR